VSGVAVGTATITASVAGKSASATVAVVPPAVFTVSIGALAAPLLPGQSAQLSTTLKDKNGAVLVNRLVAWTTSAAAVVTVDNAGKVTAVAAGTASIFATSEGIIGAVTVTVSGAGGTALPTITGISPATLIPGGSATLTGTNFDAVAANNVVTVGGIAVNVTSATATQLVVSALSCVSSGGASVKVTTNALTGPAFTHPVAVPQRTVPLGQSIILTNPGCNELLSSGNTRYIVSVFSVSSTENALTDFELSGNTPAGGSPARIPIIAPAFASAPLAPSPDAARDREHYAMLERNRAIFREGQSLTARQPLRSRSALAATPLPVIGDQRDFFYTYTGGCRDTTTRMHTKVIYVGTRSIIWEDSTNTLLAKNDPALAGYYQRLGQIFDQDQYDIIKTNFGDPLRRDISLANDGRVHMVFSEKLNGTGAAAFVTGCDQYPTTVYIASNFGLVFYGSVPTIKGSNLSSTTYPDGWFNFMGRTVVHEVKHIASFSARVANSALNFEESWLEEGTARHAEELWVRTNLEKVAWKANTGFGSAGTNGVYCDFHPENATCAAADVLRRPSYGMRRHFNEIKSKLQQPWNWSIYGDGTGQTGSIFYQTAWSLVRYAIDRYGISDSDFLTRLTNSTGAGLSNLSTLAGVSSDQLLGNWGLALYADDYPGLASPSADIQFPTWNLRSIYAGLNSDPTWAGQFPTVYPIVPLPLSYGAFATQRTGLRGGANAYFELAGAATTPQLLNVHAIGGGAPSVTLRIAIARLQ
jgi:hypothetical protein